MKNMEIKQNNFYEPNQTDTNYMKSAIKTVKSIHLNNAPGNVLLFLNDYTEVELACKLLNECTKSLKTFSKMVVIPIYFFQPLIMPARSNVRRIFITAHHADSPLSLGEVSYTIDTGFVKQRVFNKKLNIQSLVIVPTSEKIARRKTYFSGVRGKCYRLYSNDLIRSEINVVTNNLPSGEIFCFLY